MRAEQLIVPCVALFLLACGTPGDSGDVDGGSASDANEEGRYFPLAVGMSWTYRIVDVATGDIGEKVQTVEALEEVGGSKAGITAYRLRSDKPSGYTVSWQEDLGTAILRHREESFSGTGAGKTTELYLPGKLRLDESLARTSVGATFDDTYSEEVTDVATGLTTSLVKTEHWTVESVDDEITVPAGTFTCLRLRRVNLSTGSDKRYWFARGFGKIKEEGLGQIETLKFFRAE